MEFQKRFKEFSRKLKGVEVHTDLCYRVVYNYDATQLRGRCAGVVYPRSVDDIVSVVKYAGDYGVPLYVRGAGSGFSGGAVPVVEGVVVSMEKLNRVLWFDPSRWLVAVESGVVNGELQRYLAGRGFFYPPDPASLEFSTIGGNIAENAGGPRAFKYGVTRRYVHALEWVTSRGDVVDYPMVGVTSLLVGGEGGLGVIYSAVLSVLPLPEAVKTALITMPGGAEAVGFAVKVILAGLKPTVLEYIDSKTMICVGEYIEVEGFNKSDAYIFVEFDGVAEDVETQFEMLKDICRREGAAVKEAKNKVERELLWDLRRSISPSLARRGITKVNEDVTFPIGKLEEAVDFMEALALELSLDCYVFGHCGDGNLHVNIMTDRRRTEEMRRAEHFVERLFEKVVELGGSLSGEHGIGLTKRRYLPLLFNEEQIEFAKEIKRTFDPALILNPGKYFS